MPDSAGLGTLTRRQLIHKTWPLLVFTGMTHVFASLEASVFLPFLYTRVRCCDEASPDLADHYDVVSERKVWAILAEAKARGLAAPPLVVKNGTQAIPACAVPRFMPHSDLWSLSSHCVNQAFVEDQAQSLVGVGGALQKFLCLAVMPIGGGAADTHGRRPVLMVYTICCCFGCCILLCDASLELSGSVTILFGLAMFVGQWDPKDTVISGAVADIIGSHEANKVRVFAFVYCCNVLGALTGTLVAVCCLRLHLDNYTGPFAFFMMLSMFVVVVLRCVVPETLPRSSQTQAISSDISLLQSVDTAIKLVSKDRILIGLGIGTFLFYVYFVGFIFCSTSYLLSVGFNTVELLLPRLAGFPFELVVTLTLVPLLPKVPLWNVVILAHVLMCLSYLFYGPWMIWVGHSGAFLGNALGCCAMPLLVPCVQTIISQRVANEHQAKCQAAIFTCGTMGMVFAAPFYSKVLFDGTARGMMKALPALCSASLALLSAILAYLLAAKSHSVRAESGTGLELHGKVLSGIDQDPGNLDQSS